MKNATRRFAGGKCVIRAMALTASVLLAHLSVDARAAALPAPDSPADLQPSSAGSSASAAAAKPPVDLVQLAQSPAWWPNQVTLLKPISFPVVFSGRVAGQTVLPAGSQVRLVRVAAAQAEVENSGARQWIAANVTDLQARATRLRDAAASPPQTGTNGPSPPLPSRTLPDPPVAAGPNRTGADYAAKAGEVTDGIQKDFWNPQTGLYSEKPGEKGDAVIWSGGVMFSALVGATRQDPGRYGPVTKKFFDGLERYWDRKAAIPGYEPLPTNGNGNDKYYDDNEWMVITFLEAYALTGQIAYSRRAAETLKFVLSGWDETYLQGGIWWHESREKKVRAKNTCANAPAAVASLLMARVSPPAEAPKLVAMAEKIVDWTVKNLQRPSGLFADTRDIEGEGMNEAQLTYNSALMVRAFLGLYRATGKKPFLEKAQRIAVAANAMLDKKTGVYRDAEKWAHLMMEADLLLYRATKEPYLLERARKQADAYYERWKEKGPVDLITAASFSRGLWLMAEMDAEEQRGGLGRKKEAF